MSSLAHNIETFNVEFCGGLVAVAHARVSLDSQQGKRFSTRGVISGFSAKSRHRLLKLIATINFEGHKAIFVTLTYPAEFPDPMTAKAHCRAFLKRINRMYPDVKPAVLWRLEFQERGAPHFHLMFFDLPFTEKDTIQRLWMEVIGVTDTRVFTRIEFIKSPRQAMHYVAKYMAKRRGFSGGFNGLPYPATDDEDTPQLGRLWGIENRINLPICPRIYFTVTGCWGAIWQFKRYARKKWRGVNNHFQKGFTLFVSDSSQWLALFRHCVTDLDHYGDVPLFDWRD